MNSEIPLGVIFDHLLPYQQARLCVKCSMHGARTQHTDINPRIVDLIREINPAAYLEISSNMVKSILIRACCNCSYQWFELPLDEWTKWRGGVSEADVLRSESIKNLATLIQYKIEDADSPSSVAEAMKNILDCANDIVLTIPRLESVDILQTRVAELVAHSYVFLSFYRRANAVQDV